MTRILLLGGTTEASLLAAALAAKGVDAIFSYAGRTENLAPQPLPLRVGGFGGVAGLKQFLHSESITHVIDATHPFAAQMSAHAVAACAEMAVQLCSFERLPWQAGPQDRWHLVPDVSAAVVALPGTPKRIFLAIGRQNVPAFAARPEHFYLLRMVDPPPAPLTLPRHDVVIGRGPFSLSGDLALLQAHGIELIVAKNSGGEGARAKLDAARQLGLPVILIDRPLIPQRLVLGSVEAVMMWLGHLTPAALRGV